MNIVVVIPVYNPPQSLEKLIIDLSNIWFVKNIIVVDDGSKKKISLKCDKCTILRHNINKGKGAALKTAFEYLKNNNFDKLILLDGDILVNKEDLQAFCEKVFILNDKQIIIGYPIKVSKKGFGIVKRFAKFVVRIYTKKKIDHCLSGQRIIPFSLLKDIKCIPNRYGVDISMLIDFIKMGYEIREIEFDFSHNEKGKSLKDLLHKIRQMKDIFLVFITKWRA
ncbi:glycosyltransferase family 2 protein [Anaerocellum diazotrophicum]|uniref:Glycosyl transferase n=1 Tax=Caldicellulosiruptor diazotrophicus TaxID=2806205 RepID=A0ABM7NM90_9FIRM|nr:glycosyltransferase [Caldicellulosiruptor diazotrophicus]BCS81235.1 glycosyl transferase [Caldicellulosiruptor diazotrophicus]